MAKEDFCRSAGDKGEDWKKPHFLWSYRWRIGNPNEDKMFDVRGIAAVHVSGIWAYKVADSINYNGLIS